MTEGKPEEGKPAESKPADDKPAEDKPADDKPAEDKPADDKPAESKAAADKPAKSKAAADKPAELQPGEQAALAGRERLSEQVARTGMFGAETTGDTSGYGGLVVRRPPPLSSPRPYGSYFDELADALGRSLEQASVAFGDAVERVVADRGELTFHVRREHLTTVAGRLRDDPGLAFELCTGVSGVHYPADSGRELHAVYHLASLTLNRRLRLEVSVPDSDPHIPTMVRVYPTCDWHERETWDFFGLIFDGHPALTRIEMPDDWKGHPQRKDYPLGGIPVEYRGATVPPPDERRAYE